MACPCFISCCKFLFEYKYLLRFVFDYKFLLRLLPTCLSYLETYHKVIIDFGFFDMLIIKASLCDIVWHFSVDNTCLARPSQFCTSQKPHPINVNHQFGEQVHCVIL